MDGLCGSNDNQLQRKWRKLRFNQCNLYISPTTFKRIRWRQLLLCIHIIWENHRTKGLVTSLMHPDHIWWLKQKDNIEMYLKKEVLRELLWTKLILIYLQTQFVMHSKGVPSRLYKPISYLCCAEITLFPDSHTNHECTL